MCNIYQRQSIYFIFSRNWYLVIKSIAPTDTNLFDICNELLTDVSADKTRGKSVLEEKDTPVTKKLLL